MIVAAVVLRYWRDDHMCIPVPHTGVYPKFRMVRIVILGQYATDAFRFDNNVVLYSAQPRGVPPIAAAVSRALFSTQFLRFEVIS